MKRGAAAIGLCLALAACAPATRREKLEATLDTRIGLAAQDFASALGAPRVLITRARRDGRSPTVASRFLLRLDAISGGIPRDLRIERDPPQNMVIFVREKERVVADGAREHVAFAHPHADPRGRRRAGSRRRSARGGARHRLGLRRLAARATPAARATARPRERSEQAWRSRREGRQPTFDSFRGEEPRASRRPPRAYRLDTGRESPGRMT